MNFDSELKLTLSPPAMSQLPPLGDIYEDETADSQSLYHYLRNINGIPEGTPQVMPLSSIPFECNFDLLNGIDYDKGCYLGQELVARTHFRGAVRKRLFPLVSLGPFSKIHSKTGLTSSQLVSSLMLPDLSTAASTLIPQAMLCSIPNVSKASKGAKKPEDIVRVDVELDALYDVANTYPTEGGVILPIQNEVDLDAVLSGKGLSHPTGPASASRISKVAGGASWNVGMGAMRTDAWHSSPSLLFYAPSASDPSQGTILKGVKPWWYKNYLHWREEAESKATALATADEL
jgi:folate-binding protein YgfZ